MFDVQEDDRHLTTAEVLHRVPVSKTQLYRMIDLGEFPRPKPFGACRVAFLQSEIDAWIGRRHDRSVQARSSQGVLNRLKSFFRKWFGTH